MSVHVGFASVLWVLFDKIWDLRNYDITYIIIMCVVFNQVSIRFCIVAHWVRRYFLFYCVYSNDEAQVQWANRPHQYDI